MTELARRLGLAKSAVHRLLTTLAAEHLVERNRATGRYRLGIKLYELGAIVSSHLELHEAVALYIDELHNLTGETVHVAVLDGAEVVYVERRESPRTLRAFSRVGDRNFAHCTSTGKVLLAHLPHEELDPLLAGRTLEAKTPYTITDPSRLREELEGVRLRGYATNVNEGEVGAGLSRRSHLRCERARDRRDQRAPFCDLKGTRCVASLRPPPRRPLPSRSAFVIVRERDARWVPDWDDRLSGMTS